MFSIRATCIANFTSQFIFLIPTRAIVRPLIKIVFRLGATYLCMGSRMDTASWAHLIG